MLVSLHVVPKMMYFCSCLTHLITKNYNCEEMPQETEQRRLSAVKSMQNIIDSIIYAMYTRENLERWGSCFGSYFLDRLGTA